MFYICIATGMADHTPTNQEYHSAETVEGLSYIVWQACDAFDRDAAEEGDTNPSRYAFRAPREGENNWSQRLRIGQFEDWVLDVIGMTEEEYLTQNA